MKIYVSGWLEYRVDNPAALTDASAFTPEQLDPQRKSNLHDIDPRAWSQLGNALLVEVAKGTRHEVPPGTTQVDSKINYSLTPPSADEGPSI